MQDNLNNIINSLKEIKDKLNINSNIGQKTAQISPLLDSLLQNLPVLQQRNLSNNKLLEEKLIFLTKITAIKNDTIKNISNNTYQKPIPIKWLLGS